MVLGGDPEVLPPPLSEVLAFQKLVAASSKRHTSYSQQKFVKKLDNIPMVALHVEESCRFALNLAERGLIGKFTGLCLSPKFMEVWV